MHPRNQPQPDAQARWSYFRGCHFGRFGSHGSSFLLDSAQAYDSAATTVKDEAAELTLCMAGSADWLFIALRHRTEEITCSSLSSGLTGIAPRQATKPSGRISIAPPIDMPTLVRQPSS